MIIDFRIRPPVASFLRLGIYAREFITGPFKGTFGPPTPSMLERSSAALLEELRGAQVSHGVVWGRAVHDPGQSTSNDDIAGIVAEHRGMLSGLGGICVRNSIGAAIAEVDRVMKELHLSGITVEPGFHNPPLYPDDAKLYPVYQRCEDLGGLLAFTMSGPLGPDIGFSDPVKLDHVARDFPRLKIVVSHACWPWVTQACGVAFCRPNVYLLPDLYGVSMPGYLQYVEAANTYLEDRILFATAYPIGGIRYMVEGYSRLPFRDEVRDKVMYKNASKLLGLS